MLMSKHFANLAQTLAKPLRQIIPLDFPELPRVVLDKQVNINKLNTGRARRPPHKRVQSFVGWASCPAGETPTPQESSKFCGVGILPAPCLYKYFYFIYLHPLID
jgi:hypothetical protein